MLSPNMNTPLAASTRWTVAAGAIALVRFVQAPRSPDP
jgi:hypothetical protein